MRYSAVFLFAAVLSSSPVLAQYRPGVNNHVTLLGRLDQYGGYANVWGYTDSKGNEYALLGASTGLSIINITDPRHPVEVAFVPGAGPTIWREIKTYSHYAYVVNDVITTPNQYTGIQVVDLSTLPNPVAFSSVLWPNVTSNSAVAHTVSIDSAGYLYIQGGTATAGTGGVSGGGVRIFSLANPQAPAPVGFYSPRYVHDSFVKKNILFNSNIGNGGRVDVLDITDRSQPRLLTSIIYPRGASHNSGTTEDGNYLFTTDEDDGLTVKVWDIRVLWDNDPANDNNIELVAEYIGDPAQIAHNVHIRGNHAYISHYVEGVKVLDITNPREPAEVGYYDTFPQPGGGFSGDWGVFPYFPSGNFVVSDIQTGLYVLSFDSVGAGAVAGKVTNSETGAPLVGASVHFVEANKKLQTDSNGNYRLRTGAGPHTIVVQAFPFQPDTAQINLAAGATLQHNRGLKPSLAKSALTGAVREARGFGIRAKLTLYASSNLTQAYTITDSSDAQGNFAFEDIFVSSPPTLVYQRLVVEPEIPYPNKTLTAITVNAGSPTVLNITLEPADVLLVNDDPNGDFQNYYLSALDSLRVTAFLWTQQQRGLAPVSLMSRFKRNTLIWYTGNAASANVLAPAERDSIAAYLDRGGRIFLTGQNIAESLNGTSFLANRLHVAFVQNLNDFLLHGVQNDPVGKGLTSILTAGATGANNQTSRDVLQPDGMAQACVVYDTTTGVVAGVRIEDPGNRSRLVFWGFGFEAIARPRQEFATREQVMRNVLNWLEGVTAVDERTARAETIPSAFHLSASFPNPFRVSANAKQVVIHYQLPLRPEAERVMLRIFDVLGREMVTLVDKPYQPGDFVARWDGRDEKGNLLGSGVYFYQLEAGSFRQVQKLVYVR